MAARSNETNSANRIYREHVNSAFSIWGFPNLIRFVLGGRRKKAPIRSARMMAVSIKLLKNTQSLLAELPLPRFPIEREMKNRVDA